MREVEQVVVDELVIGTEMVIAGNRSPGRIVHPVEIRDERRIGKLGVAKPDPRETVPFDQRIFAYTRARNLLLAGHTDALAVTIEAQPVVSALDLIADHPAKGEG